MSARLRGSVPQPNIPFPFFNSKLSRRLCKWFSVEAAIEPKKGGRVHFRWLGGDEFEGRIIRVVKDRVFVLPFGSNVEEVEVKFRKKGNGCICALRQYNMQTTEKAKWEFHKGCSNG